MHLASYPSPSSPTNSGDETFYLTQSGIQREDPLAPGRVRAIIGFNRCRIGIAVNNNTTAARGPQMKE